MCSRVLSHRNPPPLVTVRSIETKRMGVQEVHAGQSATFAVRVLGRRPALRRGTFRKGMVCIAEGDPPQAVRHFEAAVVILHHSTTISEGYQVCGSRAPSFQIDFAKLILQT